MIPITLIWREYLLAWWRNRSQVQQKNRRDWWGVLIFLGILLVNLTGFIGLEWLIRMTLLPTNWLFYESNLFWGKVASFFLSFSLLLVFENRTKFWKWQVPSWVWQGFLLATLASYLIYMEQVTVVTPDRIVMVDLFGKDRRYTYEDVVEVETGFGGKRFTLDESQKRGTFSYRILLDGQRVTFMQPSVNEEAGFDDTYLELEKFDQDLMRQGTPKISSSKHSEKNNLDPRYTKRFLRIIQKRPENVRE